MTLWGVCAAAQGPAEEAEGPQAASETATSPFEGLLRESGAKAAAGDLQAARELAARAVAAAPASPRARLQRGSLSLRLGSLDEAVSDASKAVELGYEKPAAYNLRSEAYARQGRFQEAFADAERSVALNPKSPWGYLHRAAARQGLGGPGEEILSDLRRAAELDPQFQPRYDSALRKHDKPRPAAPADVSRGVSRRDIALGGAVAAALALLGLAIVLSAAWRGRKAKFVRFGSVMERPKPSDEPRVGSVVGGRFILGAAVEKSEHEAIYEGRDLSDEPRTIVCYRRRGTWAARAKAAASLAHPSISPLEAALEDRGHLFLVYAPLAGDSLRRLMDLHTERRQTPEQALRLSKPLCDALDYAHGCGVVHGHLRPSLILVDKGRVAVRDFGLFGDSASSAYQAPEAETGDPLPASDLFSVGACLYEMLTGCLPFEGPEASAARREGRFLSVSRQAKGLPSGVDDFFSRALHPDAARRFASAGELYLAFRALVIPAVQ